METIILIVLVVLLLISRSETVWGLIVNGVIGVILLSSTNLFLEDDNPINLVTVLICAIGGVVGWLIILVFHLLEITF